MNSNDPEYQEEADYYEQQAYEAEQEALADLSGYAEIEAERMHALIEKEVNSDVLDLVNCILDLGTAQDLLWASNELSNQAQARHEAEKMTKEKEGKPMTEEETKEGSKAEEETPAEPEEETKEKKADEAEDEETSDDEKEEE